jgi:hypothetical protein
MFALFVFAAVFFAVAMRALFTADSVVRAAASLPLADESEARRES